MIGKERKSDANWSSEGSSVRDGPRTFNVAVGHEKTMKNTLWALLTCFSLGCATESDLTQLHENAVRRSDVIILCHRGTNGPNEQITIREIWRDSPHPDWKYQPGDVLPPETYGGPYPVSTNGCCGGGYMPPPDYDEIAFLTIMRRYLVTDCGYTEAEASEIVPKRWPVFMWYSMRFRECDVEKLRRKYKKAAPNKTPDHISEGRERPSEDAQG